MSAQIKDGRRITDDHDPRPVHAVGAPPPEPVRVAPEVATDPSSQRLQDSMAQLVRQGQDTSLRSLQVWADLARRLGHTEPRSPTGTTICALACDPFEKLLEAQRQVVDELVATQRQLVQQLFDATTVGGGPVPC
jgi:hypothetical protein